MSIRKRLFLGIPFVSDTADNVVSYLIEQICDPSSQGLPVHLIPAHGVSATSTDHEFLDVLNQPGLVIPDGRWLELLTRHDPEPLFQLRGADLFTRVCERGVSHHLRHYFLGSSDDLLQKLIPSVEGKFPGIHIAGYESFPYQPLDSEERQLLVARILQSGAGVVWFGISTPRQNKEASWLSPAIGKPVVCVGAALEFVAGTKKVAPRWVQRAGIEWLYRFAREPRRLWRRYVFGSLTFLRLNLAGRKSN